MADRAHVQDTQHDLQWLHPGSGQRPTSISTLAAFRHPRYTVATHPVNQNMPYPHYTARLTRGLIVGFVLLCLPGLWAQPVPSESIDPTTALTLDQLRTLTDVLGYIQTYYVEDTTDQALLEDAIRGMIQNLDPHSSYLSAAERRALEEDNQGQYGGIGIYVRRTENGLMIREVTRGTPADAAGLVVGDLIRDVNGLSVRELTIDQVLNQVRGEIGSEVALTISSANKPTMTRRIDVPRALIVVPSVFSRLYQGDFGYLRISEFQTGTAETASQSLTRLMASADDGLNGLVLDLRGNSGGVLNAAVGLADLFLSDGVIVTTRSRDPSGENSDIRAEASALDESGGTAIVVLVDSATASAAEIVAAALQDHRRALLVGERTFGKGSVQTVLPLRNGGAVKLTTARYYSPDGHPIQARGILPGLLVPANAPEDEGVSRARAVRSEASLNGALAAEPDQMASALPDWQALLGRDYRLYRALQLLHGTRLLHAARINQALESGRP